jgi:hypothetical protein
LTKQQQQQLRYNIATTISTTIVNSTTGCKLNYLIPVGIPATTRKEQNRSFSNDSNLNNSNKIEATNVIVDYYKTTRKISAIILETKEKDTQPRYSTTDFNHDT